MAELDGTINVSRDDLLEKIEELGAISSEQQATGRNKTAIVKEFCSDHGVDEQAFKSFHTLFQVSDDTKRYRRAKHLAALISISGLDQDPQLTMAEVEGRDAEQIGKAAQAVVNGATGGLSPEEAQAAFEEAKAAADEKKARRKKAAKTAEQEALDRAERTAKRRQRVSDHHAEHNDGHGTAAQLLRDDTVGDDFLKEQIAKRQHPDGSPADEDTVERWRREQRERSAPADASAAMH